MTTQEDRTDADDRIELLQGTLDILILRTLKGGAQHGQGIARAIQATSGDTLLVDHGSLYPALQRLEKKRWIVGDWGISSNNRRARFYALTAAGEKQLVTARARWARLVEAMDRVLEHEPGTEGS